MSRLGQNGDVGFCHVPSMETKSLPATRLERGIHKNTRRLEIHEEEIKDDDKDSRKAHRGVGREWGVGEGQEA